MEVKGKKRKAEKLGVNKKLHENGKPPAKKNKNQKEIKLAKRDDKLQNGVTLSQSNKKIKKKPKQSDMNEKEKKDSVTVKSKVIEKNIPDMETEIMPTKNRAERRRESGQYKPEHIDLNEEQLKERIEKISSRDDLSKTARRKLAVFKKKLQILQGTYVKRSPPTPSGLSKNARRNLRKKELHKKVLGMLKNEDHVKDVTEKAINAAKTIKGLKIKSNEYFNDESFNKKKENAQNAKKQLKTKKIKVEPEENIKNEEIDEDNEECDEDNEESEEDNEESDEDNEENDEDNEETDEPNEESDADDVENNDEDEDEVTQTSQLKKKAELNKSNIPKAPDAKNASKKTRYVLFVGNIPYTTTVDDIKKHFLTKVSDVTSVRIPLDQKTKKPRGIAYVEFNNSIDYEKGLSLHHSQISGRRINVLYSQSGSKTVSKRPNVVAKNKKLHALRKQGKLAGSVKETQKRSVRRNKQKNKNA